MKFKLPGKNKCGFTLLEVLVGAAILTASFVAILTAFDRLNRASGEMTNFVKANFLLEEGLEVVRIWRDLGWTNLSTWPDGQEYYVVWGHQDSPFDQDVDVGGTNSWATTTTPTLTDNRFDRRISISSVSRDGNGNIVTSGGSDDPGTKLATVIVRWTYGQIEMERQISAYFTNVF